MGPRGAEAVGREMRHAPCLEVLYLTYNDIGDSGVEDLLRELRYAEYLEELHLFENGISKVGERAVMALLAEHPPPALHVLKGMSLVKAAKKMRLRPRGKASNESVLETLRERAAR
uniref:Uncharacterized protein n=2 Tax=Pinguiococcus pyrenoidosus TaxID=172671 RepID=A0A6U0VKV0_9STRA|mmetsp:Transcript_3972/g.15314  ORF Transcript_3972/g.15314 Transcript_3972/m.15314 type:complete len:116 (+) Transcript_3972:254-601(+)|eukprot:scaffold1616_cov310-Pinguiococcus_pyrenoidosus.AAC.33